MIEALDEQDVADWLGNLVAAGNNRTVVAEWPPAAPSSGFIGFGDEPDDPRKGHVYSLYTSTRRRSRAESGGCCSSHALGALAARGRQTVTLWVFEENERAPRLLRRSPGSSRTAAAGSSRSTAPRRSGSPGPPRAPAQSLVAAGAASTGPTDASA